MPESSVSGTLEQFPFAEFVQTLSNLRKSGRLTLFRFGERGVVFFRDGRIIGAASSSVRETLGSLLVGRGLIDVDQLQQALEVQGTLSESRRLGSILLTLGLLAPEELESVVRQQTQRVVNELIRWKHGHFEFENLDLDPSRDKELEGIELPIPEGLSVEGALLTAAVDLDTNALPDDSLASVEPSDEADPPPSASLRSLLHELRSPELTGELTETIVHRAGELADRCVLFSVHADHFCGMGYCGPEAEESLIEAVRDLRIGLDEPSILSDVLRTRKAFVGSLAEESGNHKLVDRLGGETPQKVLAAPLLVGNRVAMVVYCSGFADRDVAQSTEALEGLLREIGHSMEEKLGEGDEAGAEAEAAVEAAVPALGSDVFRSFLDADPEPIAVVDLRGIVQYANQAFAAIVGRDVDDLPGEAIGNSVHGEDLPELMEVILEVGRGGAPGGQTVRLGIAESDDSEWRSAFLLPVALGLRDESRLVLLRSLGNGMGGSRRDLLTGLLDYSAFVERLARKLERTRRTDGGPFGLLFLGMDKFNVINVRHGWACGNRVLRVIADRLARYLRPGDLVTRVGGDRFCVLLDRLREPDDAQLVAERLVAELAEPLEGEDDDIHLSVSVGVVTSRGDYDDAQAALADAREALHEAKLDKGQRCVRRS